MKAIAVKLYNRFKHLLPERALYSEDYFLVKKLLLSDDPEAIQLAVSRQLRKMLFIATQHTEYYSKLGINAAVVKNEDPFLLLQEFPYVEKDEIMDSPDLFINNEWNLAFANYATSGGSSGKGIGVWRSKASADVERAFYAVRWGNAGYQGDRSRVLRIGADARRRLNEDPVFRLGAKVMLSPYHISETYLNRIVSRLASEEFHFIHAYPSALLELTRLLQGALAVNTMPIKAIFLASEPISAAQVDYLKSYWKCKIITSYGLAERTNLGFCFHDEDSANIEYKLEPLYSVSENYPGSNEIVGTSLWNDVMPLVRYRTKDYGTIVNGCISNLEGREQDYLTDKYGNRIPGTSVVIDEVTWSEVRQYQVRQRRPGAIDLLVVPRRGSIDSEFRTYILNQQRGRWGEFFDISLEVRDSIPLTPAGKSKLVDIQI